MTNTSPATTLRERMIEDMKLHRLCRTTQHNYLRDVSRFATWLGRPPDTATDENLRRYQIEQTETGFGAPAMNTAVSALRFFYGRTLDRPDLTRKLHRVKHPRALPTVLSREEVTRMLNATTSIKHQAILSVAYGAGLRASEVAHLKIGDIDSERMLLRVECGKGGRHRNAMAEREADLLPVGYFHVVFTLPAEVADIAWQNKAVTYDLLFKAASETMLTIAADPKHLGARIGITAVLHTWGSAMTHHPHVHMIVPGGGIAPGGGRWITSRPAFLLPVRVLGALFRRVFLTRLMALHQSGKLAFFVHLAHLAERHAFLRCLSSVRKKRWVVYAKPPFGGPEAVLAYLSRYTHRIAISNRRLIAFDERGVTFRFKDYRRDGPDRQQVMTLATDEFIRRFLPHVLPRGFHRIRHYGLLAGSSRKTSIALARQLLDVAPPTDDTETVEPVDVRPPCPCCGGHRIIIEAFERWQLPRAPPTSPAPIRGLVS
ncbi:MAG: transposase [Sphingomonadales bacterium]|nr:transposase [Sphingomonadales bacterium]